MQKFEAVMALVKNEDLIKLAEEYAVDKCNTKIVGSLMFTGLMKLILSGYRASLRMLEMLINQGQSNDETVTYSGLSKRLKTLKVEYFKAIYENLVKTVSSEFQEINSVNLYRFDSTIITLSGRMIKDGIGRLGGKETDTQIKVSVGLKNQLPSSIRFCTDISESSEDIALSKAINEAKVEKEDVLLFDRGLNGAEQLVAISKKDQKFITRISPGRKHKVVRQNINADNILDKKYYGSDDIIHLFYKKQFIETDLRLIKMLNDENTEIWFLTNLFESSAEEVAEMYKRRWDIEVFFKFIKQNLGYKHFLSHNMNGMKVYIYMILITAVLFLLYKKRCNLSGFKIAFFDFSLKTNKLFYKNLLVLHGIDPESEISKKYLNQLFI